MSESPEQLHVKFRDGFNRHDVDAVVALYEPGAVLVTVDGLSTVMTTNRPTQDWGQFLGDVPATTAILDRFLAHAEIIQMQGKSYRLHQRARQGNGDAIAPKASQRGDA